MRDGGENVNLEDLFSTEPGLVLAGQVDEILEYVIKKQMLVLMRSFLKGVEKSVEGIASGNWRNLIPLAEEEPSPEDLKLMEVLVLLYMELLFNKHWITSPFLTARFKNLAQEYILLQRKIYL